MYSSSSHEEPDWLFFFLSESSSKIQAQPVDGPSMRVSTCSFVVLHRLFSFFLSVILTRFLPSLLLFRRVVCVGKSQRETETESECLCLCVCVCVWIVPRDSVGLLPSSSSFWSFLLSKNSELVAILSCTCLRILRRCISSQHERGPPPASELGSKRSKHEEWARGHDFVSSYSSSSSSSSFLR
jgi:hypothetical protein